MSEARITITYCTKCNWLLRSGWLAQELLQTFPDELSEVSLRPGDGGRFEINLNDAPIWTFAEMRRFPDAKELKQIVRDVIAPDRNLGHSDRQKEAPHED